MAKEYVKQAVSSDGTRTISAQRGFSWQRFLFQWEWMLVLMLILVNVFNISASPYYAHAKSILNAIRYVPNEKGVLCIATNHAGDVLNFELVAGLAEMEGIHTRQIYVSDDITSAEKTQRE